MRELRRSGDELNPDMISEVRSAMFDCKFHDQRGPRDQMSRWLSWMKSEEWWSQQLSCRLLFMLYLGLELGYLQKAKARSHLLSLRRMSQEESKLERGAAASNDATPNAVSAPMSAGKAAAQKIRDACENTMHACMLIHSCERFVDSTRMITLSSKPYRDLLSHWRHFLRSREEGLRFAIDQARCRTTLAAIFKACSVVSDGAALEDMGFLFSSLAADKRFRKTKMSDCEVLHHDAMAKQLGLLLGHLARHFLRNLSEAYVCYPRKFAEFAEPPMQGAALHKFRIFVEAFEKAKDQRSTMWRKLCARCCISLTRARLSDTVPQEFVEQHTA